MLLIVCKVFLVILLIILLKDINLYLSISEDEGYWDGFFGIENQYLRNYKPSGTCP